MGGEEAAAAGEGAEQVAGRDGPEAAPDREGEGRAEPAGQGHANHGLARPLVWAIVGFRVRFPCPECRA